MSELVTPQQQLEALKKKLTAAISARAELEEDFSKRSHLLIDFITKLSQLCKGLDLELDNRLANLRALLKKSAPMSDIEDELERISKLLQQQTTKNERNIRDLHKEFHDAGTLLQKAKGIPAQARRTLRELLTNNTESKDALVQYLPKLSELLSIYAEVIAAKDDINVQTRSADKKSGSADTGADITPYIKKITVILSSLKLSEKQQAKLDRVKLKIGTETSETNALLEVILEVFQIVMVDMEYERKSAKHFLTSLSEALAKVQFSVKNTISETDAHRTKTNKINQELSAKLSDVAHMVETSETLSGSTDLLGEKFEQIADKIEEKNATEEKYFIELRAQLQAMQERVATLENQCQQFEKRIEEQQKKSLTDGLTKLNNRAAFDEYFAKQMVRYHHKAFELAIAVIDVDDFKQINDTYGHTAGDKTLQVIASMLSKKIGGDTFIARYGGEEFVIVFNHLSKDKVMELLNSARTYISKLPFKFKNNKVNITTSIGVTNIRDDDNIHTAFERADSALYDAKRQGKNQVIYQ
ncbi:diguanylate cyclase [Thalassotalea euphylliae]|uniref:diguanylate cyclase n=1 Tax=Thalassotalea euphylliae TaxID=1655234 RepID=UPI003638F299